MADNTLYYGDNLDILRRYVKDDSVDLVYLDPPFNSNQVYNVLFTEKNGSSSQSQIKAFEDTWKWDETAVRAYQEVVEAGGRISEALQAFRRLVGDTNLIAYLSMMAPRLVELRRVLKPAGSIYLHCDPTANHYLKVLMDAVFGPQNFRCQIIWKRSASHGAATNFHDVQDTILYYVKTSRFTWNPSRQKHDPEYVESHYRSKDDSGRPYQLVAAHGPGQGPPRRFGDRMIPPPSGRHWMDQETIDKWQAEGRVVFTKTDMPRYKRYLDETAGRPIPNIWTDIPPINSQARERLGYPTQKPEALLERIIRASSNEGDTVLDPFCGCGTTIAAAHKLNRRWIGIDITHLAITLIKHRLQSTFGDEAAYKVVGEPASLADAEALANNDPYQFQWWALGLVGARPVEQKKGADKGIDGRLYFHDESGAAKTKQIVLQVKAGHATPEHVRSLRGVVDRENAEIGVLISMQESTAAMRAEAASAGTYKSPWRQKSYPKLQIITVAELLEGKRIEYPPSKQVNVTFKKAPKTSMKGYGREGKRLFGADGELSSGCQDEKRKAETQD